jgi:hypothetical protein
MRRWIGLLAAGALAGACAPTNSTGVLPIEVLVVLDSIDQRLDLIPVDSGTVARTIGLAPLGFVPQFVAARGGTAVVAGTRSAVWPPSS